MNKYSIMFCIVVYIYYCLVSHDTFSYHLWRIIPDMFFEQVMIQSVFLCSLSQRWAIPTLESESSLEPTPFLGFLESESELESSIFGATGVGAGVGVINFLATGVGVGIGVKMLVWSQSRSRDWPESPIFGLSVLEKAGLQILFKGQVKNKEANALQNALWTIWNVWECKHV